MRKLLFPLLTFALLSLVPPSVHAQSKLERRYAYTLKNLHLNKETEAKFAPVLKAYLKERKEANDKYDDLKDKYKSAEKAGTITDAQATQLLDAKLECAGRELEVKKKYYVEFAKVLKPKKIYYAFDLAGDKMSKIEGQK